MEKLQILSPLEFTQSKVYWHNNGFSRQIFLTLKKNVLYSWHIQVNYSYGAIIVIFDSLGTNL